jgi:hypothetical protein
VEGARGSDASSSGGRIRRRAALIGGTPSSNPNTCFHFEDELERSIASSSKSIKCWMWRRHSPFGSLCHT